MKLYGEELSIIIDVAPPEGLLGVCKPGWISLRDRFKKISAERRSANRQNAAASGITEEVGERERVLDSVLDELILEMEEFEWQKRSEKDDKCEGGCSC